MTDVYASQSTNELDDLNFGFEYDDISFQGNTNNVEESSLATGKMQSPFQTQQKYYDINDLLAYNNSSTSINSKYRDSENYSVSTSYGMSYYFSPSSLNYKLWLQQQIMNKQK